MMSRYRARLRKPYLTFGLPSGKTIYQRHIRESDGVLVCEWYPLTEAEHAFVMSSSEALMRLDIEETPQ